MKTFELRINDQAEVDPAPVAKRFMSEIFHSSTACLAIDYQLGLIDRVTRDLRPKLTFKNSFDVDIERLMKSCMAGFSLFIVSSHYAEELSSIYENCILDDFETGIVNDFSDIPIEDGRVKDVMEFVSLFSFAKSLVIFAHDGHPVFICDLT